MTGETVDPFMDQGDQSESGWEIFGGKSPFCKWVHHRNKKIEVRVKKKECYNRDTHTQSAQNSDRIRNIEKVPFKISKLEYCDLYLV